MKYNDFNESHPKDTIKIDDNELNEYKEEYQVTLENVLLSLQRKVNSHYIVEMYQNDIFTWKIYFKEKNISLIMDFSDPPNYDLLSITSFENYKNHNLKSSSSNKTFNLNLKKTGIPIMLLGAVFLFSIICPALNISKKR